MNVSIYPPWIPYPSHAGIKPPVGEVLLLTVASLDGPHVVRQGLFDGASWSILLGDRCTVLAWTFLPDPYQP